MTSMQSEASRYDYLPLIDRPRISWPNGARVAFWVCPNIEFYEYLPQSRPTVPDVPGYARNDYGNRHGFWRGISLPVEQEVHVLLIIARIC